MEFKELKERILELDIYDKKEMENSLLEKTLLVLESVEEIFEQADNYAIAADLLADDYSGVADHMASEAINQKEEVIETIRDFLLIYEN